VDAVADVCVMPLTQLLMARKAVSTFVSAPAAAEQVEAHVALELTKGAMMVPVNLLPLVITYCSITYVLPPV
jgi:hypothetical protein